MVNVMTMSKYNQHPKDLKSVTNCHDVLLMSNILLNS